MHCRFLANCGLHLISGPDSLLVDTPNGLNTSFDGLPQKEFEKILAAEPPYGGVKAMIFTHRHADHYDAKRVRQLLDGRQEITSCSPNGQSRPDEVLQFGCFTVRCFSVPHSGEEFSGVPHRALLIDDGCSSVYITGDADWTSPVHRWVLSEFSPKTAVWNPNYISHPDGRRLLSEVPANYIYHLPVTAADVYGFGRKCRTQYEKHADSLRNVTPITHYPTSVEI